jgi:hypothetical protein
VSSILHNIPIVKRHKRLITKDNITIIRIETIKEEISYLAFRRELDLPCCGSYPKYILR